MPTFSAACLSMGITVMLYSFKAIRDHWYGTVKPPSGPWPYTQRCGILSGLLLGLGFSDWLL